MELVEIDAFRNPRSSIGEIHARLGSEITRRQHKRILSSLAKSGRIFSEGIKRGIRYMIPKKRRR